MEEKEQLNGGLDFALNSAKVAHGMLSSVLMKTPAGAAIAIGNDAMVNIGISTIAQDTSIGKSSVKFIGGLGGGLACSATGYGIVGSAVCAEFGSQLSGYLYDQTASLLGYDNTEDYISHIANEYPQSSLKISQILQDNNIAASANEGDFIYINSPTEGQKMFTKTNGELVEVPMSMGTDTSMLLDNFKVDSTSIDIKSANGDDNFKITIDDNKKQTLVETNQDLKDSQKIGIAKDIFNSQAGQNQITINPGDTLSDIAQKYGTTVEELQKLNNIDNPDKINAGDALKIKEDSKTVSVKDGNGDLSDYKKTDGDTETLLANSGQIATDAVYVDSDGNPIPPAEAFYVITDEDGNKQTIQRDGVEVTGKDGNTYKVDSLISMISDQGKKMGSFMDSLIKKSVDKFSNSFFDDKALIASMEGEFLGRILIGDSIDEIAADIASKLVMDGVVDNIFEGIFDFGDNGNLVDGKYTQTQAFTIQTIQAGLITFGTTIATRAAQGETLHSEDYANAASTSLISAAANKIDFVNLSLQASTSNAATNTAGTTVATESGLGELRQMQE